MSKLVTKEKITKTVDLRSLLKDLESRIAPIQMLLKDLESRGDAIQMQDYHEERIAALEDCVFECSQCGSAPCPNKDSLESRVAAIERIIKSTK